MAVVVPDDGPEAIVVRVETLGVPGCPAAADFVELDDGMVRRPGPDAG